MKRCVLVALCLAVCAPVIAEPPEGGAPAATQKPAWKWTLDERLAARFDPKAVEARSSLERARARAFPESNLPEDELFDIPPSGTSVHGAANPELFLPHELFDDLIHTCFPPQGLDQNHSRRMIERRAAALGLGSDLWQRLRKSAAPLIEHDLARERRFREAQKIGQTLEEKEGVNHRCHLRATAMDSARRELGDELFMRLLYEAVAPNISLTYNAGKNLESLLRYQEEGCR